MKNKHYLLIIFFLTIIAIVSSPNKKTTFFSNEQTITSKPTDVMVKIKNSTTNNIEELNLEDYIIGVVAGEMPASFEMEALKAQAIAARTYALYKIKSSTTNYDLVTDISNQVYLTKEDMQKKWSTDYEKYYNKIKEAVNSTNNLVMTYNGEVINSFYFAISNGYTEDVTAVFGASADYLKSVESIDTNVANFLKTINLSKTEFCQKLNISCNTISIQDIKRNNTNHVESITINNQTFKGTTVRSLLNLRSTDFTIEIANDVKITTKGYGHGVGMSQYGANEMAKLNQTYPEILKHYYQNIKIEQINV